MTWVGVVKYGLLLVLIGIAYLVQRWIYRRGYKKGYALGKRETEKAYESMASDIHERVADGDTGYRVRNPKATFRLPKSDT